MSKKVITAPWGKIRLSVHPTNVPLLGYDVPPAMISIEVWRRALGSVVDEGLMRADELAALGSDEVREWMTEEGLL